MLTGNFDFNFSDERLAKRANKFLESIRNKESIILHKLSGTWKDEIANNRFLSNPKVTPHEIMKGVCSKVAESVTGKHILILEDSSELNYSLKKDKITGLGKIGRGKEFGYEIHPNLAIDAEGYDVYGISAMYSWKRKEDTNSKSSNVRAYKNPAEKESGRWITTAQESINVCSSASMRTVVCDREADFYEMFSQIPDKEKNNHILVRCSKNRNLYQEEEHLFEYIDKLSVKFEYTIELPKTDKRSAHEAKLEVKYSTVKIKRPAAFWNSSAPSYIELNIIDVKEKQESVIKEEEPVHWRLFTSHSIENNEKALLVIKWYCARWWIEQLFRTLKNKGFRIEDAQVEQYEKLEKLVLFAIITSVTILQLTIARNGISSTKINVVFTKPEIVLLQILCKKYEGKTEKQKNPYPEDSLAYGSWVIARLGGWKGYASQIPPGPVTMLEGIRSFNNILEGFLLSSQI